MVYGTMGPSTPNFSPGMYEIRMPKKVFIVFCKEANFTDLRLDNWETESDKSVLILLPFASQT